MPCRRKEAESPQPSTVEPCAYRKPLPHGARPRTGTMAAVCLYNSSATCCGTYNLKSVNPFADPAVLPRCLRTRRTLPDPLRALSPPHQPLTPKRMAELRMYSSPTHWSTHKAERFYNSASGNTPAPANGGSKSSSQPLVQRQTPTPLMKAVPE